jgi:flagellar FliJ protein
MRFRFRLDALLRIRHFELRRRIALLAERRRAHEALVARERAQTDESARAESSARAALATGVDAARIHGLAEIAATWRRLASQSAARAARAERAAALEATAAQLARTRVEVLERLRERRLVRWRADRARAEQRDLDELGVRRLRRRGSRS